MSHNRLLPLLTALLLLAVTTPNVRAQETTAEPPMATQVGLSAILGLGDAAYTGGEIRVYVPVTALAGLRIIPALGFASLNDVDGILIGRVSVDAGYSFVRFAGRNGGVYGKVGPRLDVTINTNVDDNNTSSAFGADLGLGIQGSLGPVDLYGEFQHIFAEGDGGNELILGLTYAVR